MSVVHQNINYDQQASAGDALSIPVFDASPHVPGITGSIEILRAGTRGKLLHVSDMYEIKNESSPPLTLAGDHTFDVYLPANAQMDSVLAAAPGQIAGTITGQIIIATPVSGESGHYSVNFPLRPGATKFAFNYDLPYKGRAAFQPRHDYPLQQFAVMIPLTMKFLSPSPRFEILATGNGKYQVRAANQLQAGDGPRFEISGAGALPPIQGATKDQPKTQSGTRPQPAILPHQTVSSPSGSPPSFSVPHLAQAQLPITRPSTQSRIWIGLACVSFACALLVWGMLVWGMLVRGMPKSGAPVGRIRMARMASRIMPWQVQVGQARVQQAQVQQLRKTLTTSIALHEGVAGRPAPSDTRPTERYSSLLQALKDALFQLEADRIRGSISGEEYWPARKALEQTIQGALARVPQQK